MSTNLESQIIDAIGLNPEIITIQYEACKRKEINKFLDIIKENGIKAGLAINPKTCIRKIKKYLDKIDYLLVMSVEAGLPGQEFIPKTIKKIKRIRKLNPNFLIGVDGGINYENTKELVNLVDILVVGSYVTETDYYEDQILKLKHIKN